MAVRPASRQHCATKSILRISGLSPHSVDTWQGVIWVGFVSLLSLKTSLSPLPFSSPLRAPDLSPTLQLFPHLLAVGSLRQQIELREDTFKRLGDVFPCVLQSLKHLFEGFRLRWFWYEEHPFP
jgi:hypothetical protein